MIGRDLSKTVLVDNSILAFGYNLSNGVPLPSFYGQQWDTELPMLVDILEGFRTQQIQGPQFDVRENLDKMFEIKNKIFNQQM